MPGVVAVKKYEIEAGTGKHRVFLFALVTEKGILASLVGGEEPHLGGVVISVPRPSLADPEAASCTSSVLPLLGHKDDEAARPVAEMLARESGMPVSVAAGIHVNNATAGEIKELMENCLACGRKLLDRIKSSGRKEKNDAVYK
ncbi:MAG: hypothetical protein K6T66_05330 [Peptococcaceae bacterium]|nr:hypothetical protein [Peptococcaceae bacterium]